jgi:hypothetical protein
MESTQRLQKLKDLGRTGGLSVVPVLRHATSCAPC